MFQFGEFIFDNKQQRLLQVGSNREVAIEPKLLELLQIFIERPNSTITRQDILDQIWAGSLVTDNAVNKLIGNLRKVLKDNAKNPRYIQTVPKRGYRLVCHVTNVEDVTHAQVESGLTEDRLSLIDKEPNAVVEPTDYTLKIVLISCCSLLFIIVAFLWYSKQSEHVDKTGYAIALTRAQGVEFSPKMHPDNEHLYYLTDNVKNKKRELWFKNINTSVSTHIELDKRISNIIAVTTKGDTTKLIVVEKNDGVCEVHQVLISLPNQEKQMVKQIETLFDCKNKRVKDIDYHSQQHALYYTAQPKNFWPNHIYTFDISAKTHSLVTQVEPTGWGHHNIDISPNGEKLLVMSTDSDHKTQLLSLNLQTNEMIAGIKFNRPVYQAIWHHDSEHIFYYSEPPAHQIIKSDLNGENAIAIVSVSEELSSNMSRFSDGKNLIFTTESKNYDNRWLVDSSQNRPIHNSNVFDSSPAFYHLSERYLFASHRSGHMQLFLANDNDGKAKIVTNFSQSHSLGYMSISSDDNHVLMTLDEKVYLVPLSQLSEVKPMTLLKPEYLVYTSEAPLISIDWQGNHNAAITVVNNGTPELILVNLSNKEVKTLPGNWAYGLTDVKHPDYFYVIENQSNRLYRADLNAPEEQLNSQFKTLKDTKIILPKEFYLAKIDHDILYYATTENGDEFLHSVPLDSKFPRTQFSLNNISRFDVKQRKIMVSDVDSQESDIYRSVY